MAPHHSRFCSKWDATTGSKFGGFLLVKQERGTAFS